MFRGALDGRLFLRVELIRAVPEESVLPPELAVNREAILAERLSGPNFDGAGSLLAVPNTLINLS